MQSSLGKAALGLVVALALPVLAVEAREPSPKPASKSASEAQSRAVAAAESFSARMNRLDALMGGASVSGGQRSARSRSADAIP